jgi:hypothetical protein
MYPEKRPRVSASGLSTNRTLKKKEHLLAALFVIPERLEQF